jgi:hypothetical protein
MKLLKCPNCGRLVTARFALCDCPPDKLRKWLLQKRQPIRKPSTRPWARWKTVASFTEHKEAAVERMVAHSKNFPGVYRLTPAKP